MWGTCKFWKFGKTHCLRVVKAIILMRCWWNIHQWSLVMVRGRFCVHLGSACNLHLTWHIVFYFHALLCLPSTFFYVFIYLSYSCVSLWGVGCLQAYRLVSCVWCLFISDFALYFLYIYLGKFVFIIHTFCKVFFVKHIWH